jgi:predicted DNA-binding transcriptional regulator YafY
MKADRLLSALMLLQAYGRLSTLELATRLQVSRRTAHRDMEALCCAGIPLIALRGAQGGWELEKGWRTNVPGLDEAELRGLLMTQPSALGDPHLIAAAERAFGKLMASMPGAMQAQAASIRARVHIDPSGWRPSSEDLSMLLVVQDAVARDLRLSFLYTRTNGSGSRSPESTARTVDPLGVVCKQAVWYLVASTPAGMRTFRVSRMSQAVVLSVPFTRPPNFDLAAYWKASTLRLESRRQPVCAKLALSPQAAASLRLWIRASPEAAVPPESGLPADWISLDIEFESNAQARFIVLGLGSGVYVLYPAELRAQVFAEAENLINRWHTT